MWSNKVGSEIILRPFQVCNLSEVVVREEDTLSTLKEKVRLATILGTLQATLTNFKYVRPIWRENTEEEALLGVSLTGIMDNVVMSAFYNDSEMEAFCGDSRRSIKDILSELKNIAIDTNKAWAKKLGIKQSAAITCVKPSGTVSQLVDSASGIHPRYSDYYIRTVRADAKDPLAQFMRDKGFPCEPCHMKGDGVLVFSFPMASPSGSVKVRDIDALEQLKVWKLYQDYWCEHKPSITVYYKDEEFLQIGQWLYNNFDNVSGISFLPYSDHSYKQAPYQEIDKEEFDRLSKEMPSNVDWKELVEYEKEDTTTNSKDLACSGGVCELVDITR